MSTLVFTSGVKFKRQRLELGGNLAPILVLFPPGFEHAGQTDGGTATICVIKHRVSDREQTRPGLLSSKIAALSAETLP
ncbi:hypothetical protein CC2G_014725 [Coprinopsis cinerea AmutBmut pab1-1]|nr:hypothetical protein CC2G_014725 [Coprinopsis cinerea AmutBmut pab1-1]